ncbi:tRNA cyclic N6-threonylcarbamoyladenosine(37) synthase TcdA [Aliiglaciecola sp. LCG003]|uniref:tRNA cyclic N6-threonylcarbamoyladenosine(37) synthase TcdA n=1 Tax=Aliiglaciecola sp. LCG003 TaxID=3053655 RepID=UPI0025740023|nr:tRNA cyclic N6-threonylcarbamoyladenosine(37) synthase TcdA [Aliiglaciecola sp. LCG003]WJG10957.1 tRNA cyclic N6-threonylcarbamoyladenosine(37) synthase TcdA [Aliiglaciecola sp. LCG003]
MTNIKNRFGGTERLYGQMQTDKLRQAHFCVVGIGGVGTWVAEALARTAVGQITLIDLDDICTTNINRQLHALDSTVGESKVDAMAQRIKQINPECVINCIEDFVTAENVGEYIQPQMDYVIDAIDSVVAKAALIAHCKRNKIKIITTGGAGGQIDPTLITVGDLSKTIQDPLAAKLRSQLRRFHSFSTNPKRRFAVECVYSTEQLRYPQTDGSVCHNKPNNQESMKLDCNSGFGASVAVTASFGFFAASRAINKFLAR